jgi:hypothetical protein
MMMTQRAVEITCWKLTSARLGISRMAAPYLHNGFGVNALWDVRLTQEASRDCLRSLRVTVPLKQDI